MLQQLPGKLENFLVANCTAYMYLTTHINKMPNLKLHCYWMIIVRCNTFCRTTF